MCKGRIGISFLSIVMTILNSFLLINVFVIASDIYLSNSGHFHPSSFPPSSTKTLFLMSSSYSDVFFKRGPVNFIRLACSALGRGVYFTEQEELIIGYTNEDVDIPLPATVNGRQYVKTVKLSSHL